MEHDESHGYVRHSILNVNRQLTNKIVGIIFVISFLLWVAAVIYGVTLPTESSSKLPLDDFNSTRVFISIGFILLSAVFTLIVFIALRWIPHITSLILWTFWLPVPIFVAGAIKQTTFWSVSSAVGSIAGCLLIIILLKSEWFHLSEAVLKEACKMIISVPSTFVFALFVYLLGAFVLGITITAIIKLALAETLTYFALILILINYLFGAWTFVTIVALSWMTLSGTFAEYYYAVNKGSVSVSTVVDLFTAVCRYHIGTAAMYPLIGGLRAIYYVAVLGVHLIISGANKTIICFVIYNIFDPIMLRIILMGSAATCGIKGDDFYNSMTNTMTQFTNYPKGFLIVVKVLELLMVIACGLVLSLTTFSTFGYLNGSFNEATSWQMLFIYLVLLGGMVFVATLLTCLMAACYTIMFCLQDEVQLSGYVAATDSYVMSPNLHSALNHNGAPNWFRNSCGSCIPDFEYNPDLHS